MNISVLIVDDEPLALKRLSHLLGQIEDVEIVAAVDSGAEALRAIERLRPQLVLLDVQMPLVDGFDVVEALLRESAGGTASPPLIAFVTAYPHFAVEAFDSGAIDFACKPVRLARLQKIVARAREALAARDARKRFEVLGMSLKHLREATTHVEERHIWIRQRGELLRITTSEIEWIEAQGTYVNLHLGEGSYLVRNSIGSLAMELADEGYVRVHKSALVNANKVVRVKGDDGRVSLILQGGAEVAVGRKYRSAIESITREQRLGSTSSAHLVVPNPTA